MTRPLAPLTLAAFLAVAVVAVAQQQSTVTWEGECDNHCRLRFRTATPPDTWIEFCESPCTVTLPPEPVFLDVGNCGATGYCVWGEVWPGTADCNNDGEGDGAVGYRDFPCRASWKDWLLNFTRRTEVLEHPKGVRAYE